MRFLMAKSDLHPQIIHNVLAHIPAATFVLTCRHDRLSDGIITRWVQQCSTEPPMLVVAIMKGQAIEPMLRDARAFALCLVPNNDRRAQRLFGSGHEPDDDPFLSLNTITAETGMPILNDSPMWFDCKLEGHLSPDADCRLYLGRVVAAHMQVSNQQHTVVDPLITPPTHERVVRQRTVSVKATIKRSK